MIDSSGMILTLLFGFILGYYLYEIKRFRLGGVIAVPLIVIYTIQNYLIFPIFVVSIVLCYFISGYIAEKTLIYGRRLLYLFLMISIIITYLIVIGVDLFYPIEIEEFAIFTIFPGLISFNMYRETFDRDSAMESISLISMYFIVVFLFGYLVTTIL